MGDSGWETEEMGDRADGDRGIERQSKWESEWEISRRETEETERMGDSEWERERTGDRADGCQSRWEGERESGRQCT